MVSKDKILQKMRNNPQNWRIEDIEAIAKNYGFTVRKSGGSHVVFTHPALKEMITVPSRRPIKQIYIKKFVDLINLLNGGIEG